MLVTTSLQPSQYAIRYARELAERLQIRFVPRERLSVSGLQTKYRDFELLLVTEKEIKFIKGNHQPLFFHPSTAQIRIKRLIAGDNDILMDVCGTKEGDIILDCTAGQGSDAVVFSYAAGRSGHVTAVESELIPALLLEQGLQRYSSTIAEVSEAMRRIHVVQEHHLPYMEKLADRSTDIVYFDPMFRHPLDQSSAISPLRAVANPYPLSPSAIEQARRVARRIVVLKEHRDSAEFERLGFEQLRRFSSNIAYGVIRT